MTAISRIGAGLPLAILLACSDPEPAATPPKALRPVGPTELTGTVGQKVTGGVGVHVVDYNERSVAGAKVNFAIINGDGSVSSHLVLTDNEGIAHVDWTLGQTAGNNELTASIFGVDSIPHFVAVGNPGPATGIAITPRVVRIPSNAAGSSLAGRPVDQYGNSIAGTPTYTSRNTALVTVSVAGTITATETNANNRAGSTYIVVTAAGFTDSAKVYTLSPTDPACTGITATAQLAVGDVQVTGFSDGGICVPALAGDREYALVPFFDSPVPAAQTILSVSAVNVKGTQSSSLGALRSRDLLALSGDDAVAAGHRVAFDKKLRLAERREMAVRAPDARRWASSRSLASGRVATRATVTPKVGDQLQLNVEADAFCSDPKMRTGKTVAVTQRAVVMADLANPAGFTDADYESFGAAFDTLAYPIDLANFGEPTDVDENGKRVIIFFTHAVNEMGSGVLGFAYARDLLPKLGPLGSCPGSNVAEILYMRVPDSALTVSEAKADVIATLAHELQHVINAGRRLYVNTAGAASEEVWLNEGLSHIAEELAFYKSSTLNPRMNLGSGLTLSQPAYRQFAFRNFSRYFLFTLSPGSQGPVGLNDVDDDLETRGATWSFLRFAADQRGTANEAAFWQSLVNSASTGLQNLYDHIGVDARLLMRDWAISNFTDGLVTTDAKYTQPSWNLRAVPGFRSPSVFNLLAPSQTTPTTANASVTLRALSSEFVRFGVAANQEAYISAMAFPATANVPLPKSVLLAIVRTK